MLSRYRAAFASPGTTEFCVAGFLSRFVIAVYPIAIVLIVSARTGGYGFAGLVSGTYVMGAAFGNPISSHLTDRYGQRRTLLPFLVATAAATAVFAFLLTVRAPTWTLLIPAFAMGATLMDIGALVRARWSGIWPPDSAQRNTAYSIESTVDELIFVVGPLIGTLLALHLPPAVALSITVGILGLGRVWLASQTSTEPPVADRHEESVPAALRHRGMALMTAYSAAIGGLFGAGEVVMVAFCGEHGSRSSSGLVLGAFAFGSGLAGLAYGAVHWRADLVRRLVLGSVVFALLPMLYFAADSVASLALIAMAVGVGTAPILIAAFGLIDRIVPTTRLTSGLTWIGTGVSVGYGAGAASVGLLVDHRGAHFAFIAPVFSAMAVGALGIALGARLRVPVQEPSQPNAEDEAVI